MRRSVRGAAVRSRAGKSNIGIHVSICKALVKFLILARKSFITFEIPASALAPYNREATRLDLHDIKRIDSFHGMTKSRAGLSLFWVLMILFFTDSTTFEGVEDEFIRSEGASPPTCRDSSTQ